MHVLRHLLPFSELIRRQHGFQLRGGVIVNRFHLRALVVLRKTVVLVQVTHFLHLRVHDGLDLRFLVGGEVEVLGHAVKAARM